MTRRTVPFNQLAERPASPADLLNIQELAGHASLERRQVYLHVPQADRGPVDKSYGEARED